MIKVFTLNNRGMIELTKEEIETLIKEAYDEDYEKGYRTTTISYPISATPIYYGTNDINTTITGTASNSPSLSADAYDINDTYTVTVGE